MNNAIKMFFQGNEPDKIFTYDDFITASENLINNTNIEFMNDKEKIYHNYRKLNLQRTNRIDKTFRPNEDLVSYIKSIDEPQTWLTVTEDWCGDSAQNLPYIINHLKFNPLIELLIILRDTNLEAIDNYFTQGNPRSIPKIVAFDQNGNELFQWGPRPKIAQDLVSQLKAEGYTKEQFNQDLHLWYARNKGKELEKELLEIFKRLYHKVH